MKVSSSNPITDVLVGEKFSSKNYRGDVMIHRRKIPDARAEFAQTMIQAWGLVAARPAIGMEPQSKQELAQMPIKEVVIRACDLAEGAFEEFATRGWMLDIPSWEEMNTPPDGA